MNSIVLTSTIWALVVAQNGNPHSLPKPIAHFHTQSDCNASMLNTKNSKFGKAYTFDCIRWQNPILKKDKAAKINNLI